MFNKSVGKKIIFSNTDKIELIKLLKIFKKTELNDEQLKSIKTILNALQ
jgi:hypothetical protein